MKLKELISQYGEYEIKDLENIKSFLEKPKPKTVWDLKDDDEYFYIGEDGDVYQDVWRHDYLEVKIRKQGIIFLTEEDAEFEKRRREVYTIVKKNSYDFSREEWENGSIRKWCAYYYHHDRTVGFSCFNSYKCADLYFKSKKDIQAAIEEVGEADFTKYYLGVKDYVE